MRLLGSLVVLVAGSAAAAAPPPELVKKEMERFQGTWAITTIKTGGNTSLERGQSMTIKDRNVQLTEGTMHSTGVFELDPTQSPGWINIGFLQGNRQNKIYPGIYKFAGEDLNVLELCLGTNGIRPTEFLGGPGQYLCTMHKQKP